MAKDDMFVIMYKILAYLYECMKRGKKANPENISWDSEMFSIPEEYWKKILVELIENGYIKDVYVVNSIGSRSGIKFGTDPSVTMAGVQFLEENSMMAKAKSVLGSSFQTVLSRLIGLL
ncbi:YjcQ family protein [Eubacterium pyruvativorans]|uniref:YjcQ family protein n=1 Tax=Eubacterium pyruvativorans TaxID=155865 RepID=UPI00088B6B38|nr:YjcQ family protein [Eubacterium pyruvativorans]SDF30862.1 YjcQ protein [Eubacterium pyruvativorans]